MTASPTAPAVPSEEEIARAIYEATGPWLASNFWKGWTLTDFAVADERTRAIHISMAKAVSPLFAPILAEKERATVKHIAQVAASVAAQAGVGASETAGLIVSVLAANQEQIDRFMTEGSDLFIDGTIRPENGCLSHIAMNGQVVSPTKLREMKGQSQ